MKNTYLTLTLFFLLMTFFSFGQSRKKLETTILGSASINYYPPLEPYNFYSEYILNTKNLDLEFLTQNSGLFMVEEETLQVERSRYTKIPSQLLSIGASVQIMKGPWMFHEISLTKLSVSKSEQEIETTFTDSLGDERRRITGYETTSGAIAMRYEFGRYFGKNKKAKFKFGVSGGIEPSLYFHKWDPSFFSATEYPLRGNIFTLEVSVIPMTQITLSKKVSLDFKLIPNFLVADFGKVKTKNPSLAVRQQRGERDYNPPNINWAASILVRYKIKEPKKRRRRSQPEND